MSRTFDIIPIYATTTKISKQLFKIDVTKKFLSSLSLEFVSFSVEKFFNEHAKFSILYAFNVYHTN